MGVQKMYFKIIKNINKTNKKQNERLKIHFLNKFTFINSFHHWYVITASNKCNQGIGLTNIKQESRRNSFKSKCYSEFTDLHEFRQYNLIQEILPNQDFVFNLKF